MTATRAPAPADTSEEIAALIATLHATGRRLEHLTGGEVDSVSDQQGRSFVLQHAQETLRQREAAREAAMLDALPAHIALLDPRGRILSVNAAWRQFARDNASLPFGPKEDVGSNYLEVCDRARGADAGEAAGAAAGIRAVLDGRADSFSLEYPCHSADEQRWFVLTVVPMRDGPSGGVVVMHLDHSAERQAKEDLRVSERRFLDLLDHVDLLAVMVDADARITYCNAFMLQLTGWSRDEVLGRDGFELFMPAESAGLHLAFRALLASPRELGHPEQEIVTRTGERRLVRWNNTLLRSASGEVIGAASIGEDISARREAEQRIAHLSRVSAVLSSINGLIVHARSRLDLYRESCRIAVDVGGFRMALIGTLNADTGIVTVVADEGVDDELRSVVQDMMASPRSAREGGTMTAQAIARRCAVVANDVQNDAQVVMAPLYISRGVRAVAVLPLIVDDEVLGVLGLYSTELDFFGDDELKLLQELAGDIAFAIGHIGKQERLDYLAHYDPLTGLANRVLFLQRLQQAVSGATGAGRSLALVLLDIDRFRSVNDSLGRAAGDALLVEVAARMRRYGVEVERMARFDADHFAVMVRDLPGEAELARLLEQRMAQIFGPPFVIADTELRISARCGVAIHPDGGGDAEALLRNAEAAMQEAQRRGERCLFYAGSMNVQVAGKLALETRLRQALENHEFVLHYQAKCLLADGKLSGVEALIRWNDPDTGLVPPVRFIPVLEEIGLIHEVGRWALRQAIDEYARWRAAGLSPVRIAVNVSPLQLRNRGFVDEVRLGLGTDPHAAAGLELEITESLIMESVEHSISVLSTIRALGVTIAIDDFGTGFSSLSYLAKLPVDTLKIDRSFIIAMTTGPEGLSLVSTIINLAHSLKLKVVAEGVETDEQSRLLRLLGCDEMQGYLLSKPLPADEFESRHLAPRAA